MRSAVIPDTGVSCQSGCPKLTKDRSLIGNEIDAKTQIVVKVIRAKRKLQGEDSLSAVVLSSCNRCFEPPRMDDLNLHLEVVVWCTI